MNSNKINRKGMPYMYMLLFLLVSIAGIKAQERLLKTPGTFAVGVNYWSSHAGTHMWKDWKPEIIEKDFKQLSENGIKVLRVFPLWPDFQPLHIVYGGRGEVKYFADKNEQPLPLADNGSDGMSEEQLKHFEILADLAQKYNLKLVVGLITGWMSGQLYVPPALEGKDIMTDPAALVWQQKFVASFVKRLKNKPAIIAWDFGNECNEMQKLENNNQAYLWSSVISGAIKSEDTTRPVISGMHSLQAEKNAVWRIIDQAATTDILTTHPYSLWTRFTSQDPINSMRTILHAAAETRLYGDIGGKPALTEETGVMGPMTGGEKEKAAFARTALFSNWAHDCMGTFWWCAYDQLSFKYPPYNYASVEAELGLIKEDRTLKPVMNVFKDFSSFIDKLPFKTLPARKTEAVCILTEGQDIWSVAYSSFVLAKQAGFDFQFQKADKEIVDAPLYLLPSLKGIDPFYKDYWFKLLEKVKNGATLYMSLDDAYLPTFNEPLDIEVLTNMKRRGSVGFNAIIDGSVLNFSTKSERKLAINPKNATVLASEEDGNPLFLKTSYGKGFIYLLTFPLENNLTTTVGAFDKEQPAYAAIYKEIAKPLINKRILKQSNSFIGTTEHEISAGEKVVILINYSAENSTAEIKIKEGWNVKSALYGSKPSGSSLTIAANDAVVLMLKKQ
ncbi:glycoside hydrolase family 2 TIM barrel-domain containing protein [Flavobacterium sp. GSB-24]|uniref:glycoside hydrolase 5 family protein n=1 Tax=Flavobacterium sp. GSB-24 TaxID=2994319 RepID=UPI002490EED9|nr:glycoside hydrolase family 2 TIM barrel-domain containing protein [Flavobacterium sp. GSB-24]